MSYYSNDDIRNDIDSVLHENATLRQNLGTDSTDYEVELAKKKEHDNLLSVRDLDQDFIDALIDSLDESKIVPRVENESKDVEFKEFDWADNMTTDVEACSIENGSDCEACGS